MRAMEINIPDVVAEVTAAFERYEKAISANDVDVLDGLFWNDPRVIRYSLTDNAYGFEAIHASRLARPKTDLQRVLANTVITTFGRDLATANTEYHRVESGRHGRQSQTWVRMSEGWRVVSAHVSFMPTM
ncbi:MAG TPA: oxalurate catabolism protein HpxZ [Candidatus Eisenbacteria bacterium]|nr:oxalurate catabolism protein HpxZ [Candidatus Eisenbacteria bacterium]